MGLLCLLGPPSNSAAEKDIVVAQGSSAVAADRDFWIDGDDSTTPFSAPNGAKMPQLMMPCRGGCRNDGAVTAQMSAALPLQRVMVTLPVKVPLVMPIRTP